MPAATPIPENRLAELEGLHKSKWTALEFQRFLCVWLRVERGMSAVEIAEVVGWHPNTVRATQRDFIACGPESFRDRRSAGGRPRLLSPEEEEGFLAGFERDAGKGLLVVAGEIKAALERKLGREVHASIVYRMLGRHGWRKVKPRPRHPKQDGKAVEAFKKKGFAERVAQADTKGRPLRIMFQDEARFGRMGGLRYCWAPKPVRPVVPMQAVREYVCVFGAVSPKDGRHDSLVLPCANTDAMSMFLEAVSGWHPDEHILMFMDQASWHRSKALRVPDNMELGFLPPYSPELNPQEQVWDELREKATANRHFNSLGDVVDSVVKDLQRLESMPDLVASLTKRSWM